jgi:hypothetical protein
MWALPIDRAIGSLWSLAADPVEYDIDIRHLLGESRRLENWPHGCDLAAVDARLRLP